MKPGLRVLLVQSQWTYRQRFRQSR